MLDGGPDRSMQRDNFRTKTLPGRARRHCCELCKTAEPIDMSFGFWTRVGPRKNLLGGMYTGAMANTSGNEPSVCGGDATFLSNYFDYMLLL